MSSPRPVVLALMAALLVVGAGAPANAAGAPADPAPAGSLAARASALRTAVDQLQVQAAQASEAYDATEQRLGQAVSQHLSAERAQDRADDAAAAARSRAGRRIRALYIAGGAPALLSSLLQGADLADVLGRLQALRGVVGADQRDGRRADRTVLADTAATAALAATAAARTRWQGAAARRADEVRRLLARTDVLLGQADAQVRALADQQRQAHAVTAAAEAGAVLTAARAGQLAPAEGGNAARLAIAAGLADVGRPYLWGGNGPDSFDCSGLTVAAYRAAGITLPRTAAQQWLAGPHIALGALAPGDLLFWATDQTDPGTIHHVAIYLGDARMLEAAHSGTTVAVRSVYLDGYLGAVRPAG